ILSRNAEDESGLTDMTPRTGSVDATRAVAVFGSAHVRHVRSSRATQPTRIFRHYQPKYATTPGARQTTHTKQLPRNKADLPSPSTMSGPLWSMRCTPFRFQQQGWRRRGFGGKLAVPHRREAWRPPVTTISPGKAFIARPPLCPVGAIGAG